MKPMAVIRRVAFRRTAETFGERLRRDRNFRNHIDLPILPTQHRSHCEQILRSHTVSVERCEIVRDGGAQF